MKGLLERAKKEVNNFKKIKKVTRVKIISGIMLGIILIATALLFLMFENNKDKQLLKNITDPELARAMTYDVVEPGDEIVDEAQNVRFDAFFLRDLNGDGYAESIRGTCKEIGQEDTLYMELNVITAGYLKDAKIEINGDNFYMQTALPKDDELKDNYIGNNVRVIEFNDIINGTQKMLTGIIRSGNYSTSSGKTDALNNNINNYSKINNVTLTGIYVAEDGTETPIEKVVDFNLDWYGETKARISTTTQEKDLEDAIDEENGKVIIDFTVYTDEANKELILYKNHVEGEIPLLNGYAPTNVEYLESTGVFDYNDETLRFTIDKEASKDEDGNVTTISRSNNYDIRVEYPIEAYYEIGQDTIQVKIPVETYYEGYNNLNDEFTNPYVSNVASSTIVVNYEEPPEPTGNIYLSYFDVTIGKKMYEPYSRYMISKEKPIRIYNGISEEESDDSYTVTWEAFVGTNAELSGIVMKETKDGEEQVTDQFIKTDSTEESTSDVVSNVGIYVNGADDLLGEDGWIKVYDEETDELLVTFTKDNWNRYTSGNPYKYEYPVKNIRVETSNVQVNEDRLYVYNIKEIDDEKITEKYTRNQFDELEYIKSTLTGYLAGSYVETDISQAVYEAPISVADVSISKNTISTQATEKNEIISIMTEANTSYNEVEWKDGMFLVKLPKEIIEAKINNIEVDNLAVTITNYELIETEEGLFIKVLTENDIATVYEIKIDVDLSPDPRIATTTGKIELYASNGNASDYYYSAKDKYDVNNNLNTEEKVNYRTISLSVVSPNSLLTNQIASNFDDSGEEIVSPQIADISPKYAVVDGEEEKTVDIGVQLRNNYASTISEIMILGKIPFEGNTYVMSGGDLESTFSTTMTENGITVPDEIEEYVTVYYSENENPTKDITLESNGWETKENVSNWDNVKTYLIDLSEYVMPSGREYVFNYTLKIPNGVEFNKVAYSHHGVYFCLDTEQGKYRTQTEPNKLGLRIAEKYNLNLTKYQLRKDKLVRGATYSVVDVETGEEKSGITDENGNLIISELYAEKEYEIKEVRTPDDYELNLDTIKIIGHVDENGTLTIEKVQGNTKDEITVTKEENEDYLVNINVEDEIRARLKIVKTELGKDEKLKSARYQLTGKNYENGKTIITDENGETTLTSLSLGEEYTLVETKAPEGYYLNNEEIKFTITNNGENEYILNVTAGTIKNTSVVSVDEIPQIVFELEDEKIPTYDLVINKVAKGETAPLVGVQFRLYYGKELWGTYESDDEGKIYINGLYEYVSEKGVEQTYTLKEIYTPEGYAKLQDVVFHVEQIDGVYTLVTDSTAVPTQSAEGNVVTITLEDPKSFKLTKIDGETKEVLPGTKFAIYDITEGNSKAEPAKDSKGNIIGTLTNIDGEDYYIVETNDQGEISANLPEGLYKAVEIEASDEKYDLSSLADRTYYFGIGKSKGGATAGEEGKIIYATENTSKTSESKLLGLDDGGYVHLDYNGKDIEKFDSDGNLEWEISSLDINAFTKANNGDIIVGTNSGEIVEINLNGEIINSNNTDYSIYSIDQTEDNEYVVGTSSCLVRLDSEFNEIWKKSGNFIYAMEGENNTIIGYNDASNSLVKYDENGILIFSINKSYSSLQYNFGGVAESVDGNIAFGAGTNDDKLTITNSSGNIIFVMDYSEKWGFEDIYASANGGFLCSGWSNGNSMNIPADKTTNAEDINISFSTDMTPFLMKITEEGLVEWVKVIQTYGLINSVCEDIEGNYIITLEQRKNSITFSEEETLDGNEIQITNTKDLILKLVGTSEIPEQSEIVAENYRKEFRITTDVQEIDGIKGGTISGEGASPYETVKYGDSSTKEIVMDPNTDYEIISITVNGEEYPFEANDDGTFTMPDFTNVTENKHVVVTYALGTNKITINKMDSKTKVPLSGVKFKLDQIEERLEPNNEEILGELTGNSSEYKYPILDKEVTDVLGELTENGALIGVADTSKEVTGVLGDLTNNGTYYFVQNEDGTITPTNSKTYQVANGGSAGKQSTTANSYIPIDLEGLSGNYAVVVNAEIVSEGPDYGYATITESTTAPSYTNTTGQFIYMSGTVANADYTSMILEGGKTYYLHLGYRKDVSIDTGVDQITFNSINVYEADATSYNFVEVDGKYESNNQGQGNTTANSYMEIDLTDKEGDFAVVVNANVSSQSSNDYGYATITESQTTPAYNSSTGRFIYISGTSTSVTTPTDYNTILEGGKKYYLHLGYRKNASTDTGDDKFTVNSVNVYEAETKVFDFDKTDEKITSTNQGYANTYSRSYMEIDLRGYIGKYNLIVNAEISSDSGDDYGYLTTSTSTTATTSNYFARISGTQSAQDYTTVLEGGQKYYLHMAYYKDESGDVGTDTFTINNISLTLNDSELYHVEVITNSEGQGITQIPFGKYQITEIETASGYELLENPIVVEFRESGNTVVTNENNVEVSVNGDGEFVIENNQSAKVLVHHYLKDEEGNYTEIKVAEDELLEGKIDERYQTAPKLDLEEYDLEKDVDGEYVVPDNATGTYISGTIEVIYYYEEREIPLTIHHYIEGTEEDVPLKDGETAEDEKLSGKEGEEYSTNEITEDELGEDYELVEIPSNAEGTYEGEEIVVTYYYKKVKRDVTINKYTEDGETPLSGVEFTIKNKDDSKNQFIKTEEMQQNGEYYFEKTGGKFKSNNYGNDDTTANSYIKIDLTRISGSVIVSVNAEVSSESNYDYGFATITESQNAPAYDSSSGRFIYISGSVEAEDYSISIEGGKVYYLHFGYRKDSSQDRENDEFTINSIKINGNEYTSYFEEPRYITNTDGKIEVELGTGTYEITEVSVPEGYILPEDATTEITITRDTTEEEINITNEKIKGKVIVHHYIDGTEDKVPSKDGGVVENEVKEDYLGQMWASKESEDISPEYEFVRVEGETSGEYTEGTTEVTYFYKLKDPIIESTINKIDEIEEITNSAEEITYNINYSAKVNDYKGDALVTIVDYLPYEIDEAKSDIAGGTYDAASKTITWTEDIPEIDTYTNDEKDINISKTIVVVYKDLNIADNGLTNRVTGTINLERTDDTEEVEDTEETPINIKGKLIVKYVEEETEKELAEKIEDIQKAGTSYETEQKEIIGYDYVRVEGQTSGTYIEDTIEVTYYYRLKEPIIESNIIKTFNPEKIVSAKDEIIYNINYVSTITDYRGDALVTVVDYLPYEIDEAKSDIAGGTYDAASKTITWTERFNDIDTYTNGAKQVNITKSIKIVYGNLDEAGANIINRVEGTIDLDTPEKTVTVEDEVTTPVEIPGKVIVKYLEEGTDRVLAEQEEINGIVGDDYSTVMKELVGYDFVRIEGQESGKLTESTIEVIYYYKIKPVNIIKNEVSKTGTASIDERTDKITYNIVYEGVIDTYIGEVAVYLEDTLPYKIDVEESDLDGGTYDEGTNTIKWYENVGEIDTLETGENVPATIRVEKTIEVLYKDIDIYQDSMINEIKGVMYLPADNKTVEDEGEYETEIAVKGEVVVKYVDKNTNEEISSRVEKRGRVGTEYDVTGDKKEISGYTLIEEPAVKTGTYTEESQEKIYYYAKNTDVHVRYVDKISKEEIAEEEIIEGYEGQKYVTDRKEITGYTFVEDSGNTEGEMTRERTEVVYYYLYKTKVRVEHRDKYTDGLLGEEEQEGLEGEVYESSAKDFEGYVLVEEPENRTVTMTKEEIVLIYYYSYISGGVIEKHIDEITGEILDEEVYEGKEGDPYSTKEKEFRGYDLVEEKYPANSSGEMTRDVIEVKYYYIKRATVRVEYIDKVNDEKLTEDVIINGHENDKYRTEEKEFEGYDLVEIPENATGEMKITVNEDGTYNTEIVVTYYYKYVSAGVIEKHIDEITGEVLTEERYTGYEGDKYETKEKEFAGYDLVKEKYPENATGVMTREEIEIDYYYIKKATVRVEYVDKYTGNKIIEDVIISGHEKEEYKTEEKEFEGYDYIEVVGETEGTMIPDEEKVITYYYLKPATVITRYLEEETEEELAPEDIVEGHEGDEYVTGAKEIEYYKISKLPENATGEMKDTIYVTYYYKKKIVDLSLDKTIESMEVEGKKQRITNEDLVKAEVYRKSINSTDIKIVFNIKVTNEGEIEGKAEIVEKIPEYLSMSEKDNPGWTVEGDEARYETEAIEAGKSKTYKVVMRWEKGDGHFGMQKNIAKIEKVITPSGFDEENLQNNSDESEVMITISTGVEKMSGIILIALLYILAIVYMSKRLVTSKEYVRKD